MAALRTSPPHTAPLLVLLTRPLAAFSAALLGKSARLVWGRISPERRAVIARRLFLSGVAVGGCLGFGYYTHLQVCPYTGRTKFVALTQDQVRLGVEYSHNTVH